ncbi:MAG: FecR family protein [Candidatus Xenobia bacterium]
MRRWLIMALAGAMVLQVQAEAPQVQVTAVHGTVEARTPGGTWQTLHGPQCLPYGTAIRTTSGGSADATMADTHVHLGASSAMRASDARTLQLVGQAHVDSLGQVACNIPIGRFNLNGGQGMRPEDRVASAVPVASLGESVDILTPTARDGAMALQHGSATAQEVHHLSGHVSGVGEQSFTLVDDHGAALMTILLDEHSVMARRTLGEAREAHGPKAILERLGMEQHLLVYGTPQGNNRVLASVIYPDDGVVLDYDEWFNQPSPPVDGPSVAANSGQTLKLSAGALPIVVAGLAIGGLAVAQVGAASVLTGTAVVVGVAAAATGVLVASNNNRTTTTPPPPPVAVQTSRGIILVLSHPARRALPAIATTPAAPAGMAVAWTPDASLTVQAIGGQPMLAAQLPLGERWRLRASASASGGVGLTGWQSDLGLDRRVGRFSAIGIGWQHQAFNTVDALGNVGSLTEDATQLRYTIRF